MLLKNVKIQNYRSIKNLDLYIERINKRHCYIFLGINETGKSNILKAISLIDKNRKFNYEKDCEKAAKKHSEEVKLKYTFELDTENLSKIREHFKNLNYPEKIKMKIHKFCNCHKLLRNLKSQAFSMDIMLGVLIFLGTIVFFFLVLSNTQDDKVKELEQEASILAKELVSEESDLRVVDGKRVNTTKVENLLGNHSDIKKNLRLKNDFCVFFEDNDGNILFINTSANKNYSGLGSDIINVSNIPCG